MKLLGSLKVHVSFPFLTSQPPFVPFPAFPAFLGFSLCAMPLRYAHKETQKNKGVPLFYFGLRIADFKKSLIPVSPFLPLSESSRFGK
jgi:hypothetical protein